MAQAPNPHGMVPISTPNILEGSVPLPKCDRCGLQISYAAMNGNHYDTAMCEGGVARKEQQAAAERAHLSLQQTFTAYGEDLERVEVFKYLGRLLAYDDNDSQAVRSNLKKARGVWARLSRTMRAENASPRVCGVFYKATCNRYCCLEARHGTCHR